MNPKINSKINLNSKNRAKLFCADSVEFTCFLKIWKVFKKSLKLNYDFVLIDEDMDEDRMADIDHVNDELDQVLKVIALALAEDGQKSDDQVS